jgi:hypothetical protein
MPVSSDASNAALVVCEAGPGYETDFCSPYAVQVEDANDVAARCEEELLTVSGLLTDPRHQSATVTGLS